jgi:hypothetical protein
VVPFCDFGVCEDGVVGTGDARWEAPGDVVVSGVIAFVIAGGVVGVLPIAVLGCKRS